MSRETKTYSERLLDECVAGELEQSGQRVSDLADELQSRVRRLRIKSLVPGVEIREEVMFKKGLGG